MTFRQVTYLFLSMGILFLLSITIIFLDRFGKSSRITGRSYLFGASGIEKVSVNRPEEAYYLWKQKGFKGRTVVSLCGRVYSAMPMVNFEFKGIPINVFDISKKLETKLDWKYFLSVTIGTGIARKVVYVVPESVFSEELERAKIKVGETEKEKIDFPLFGSPRMTTAMSFFKPPDEPVLLFVCASFFKEYEPEKLFKQLVKSGMKTDYVVLCKLCDIGEVSDEETSRFRIFETLIAAENVKD